MNVDYTRAERQPGTRLGHIVTMALAYSGVAGFAAALVTLALYKIAVGETGFIIMLVIFGFILMTTGFLASQYLRDIKASLVTHEGDVVRKWHKGNLFFFLMPSFYIYVEGKVYSISRIDYGGLLEDDQVRIVCYPHSLTVERLERYDTNTKQFVPAALGTYT